MARMIFVNLPVADLAGARRFYEAIGAVNEPNFTDETAAAMVFSETIHVMLLTHDKYRQFTSKRIADAREVSEVIVALSCESRAEVDDLADKALASGGREARPTEDMGFMYLRAFEDPDGHIWESFWMDAEAAKQAMAGETADA
jgi:predicted lactoylglutathione lyase